MKLLVASIGLLSSLVIPAEARNIRDFFAKKFIRGHTNSAVEETGVIDGADQENRDLQNGCWGDPPDAAWHPVYAAGWTNGYCRFTQDCSSPEFSSELACCTAAYAGQTSGYCLSQLPNPPTTSPTDSGDLDVYYPDYDTAWSEAGCTNVRPLPSGRPTFSTMLACCEGAYAGQISGKCLSQLPSPPTFSPTSSLFEAEFWYPEYEKPWTESGCSNKLPLPFVPGGRPTYDTELACCKGAYGGQMSGTCLSQLPSPPTTSPTAADGVGALWYPDYDTAWSEAGCSAKLPLPFVPGGRPTYDTELACCKAAYAGQMSGTCLSQLPSPPTTSPTGADGVGALWYPDYGTPWSEAGCSAKLPLPFGPGGRPTYDTQIACCKAAYGGQMSGTCLGQLPSPPTTSPTGADGVGALWYPDYGTPWSEAGCSAKLPLPFGPNGRPTYDTQIACCKAAYGGQMSGTCLSQLPSPPTTSPTAADGVGALWYPDYDTAWSVAGCSNKTPLPFGPGGRPTYDTEIACCEGAYAGQMSGTCLGQLPSPPTTSPTGADGVGALWYPDYDTAWSEAGCSNKTPLPFGPAGRPTYDTEIACCEGAYAGQMSGTCLGQLPSPPTTSPTGADGVGALWYPDYDTAWSVAGCSNKTPLPFGPGGRPTYDTEIACCNGAYPSQTSGTCLGQLPNPPTTSPIESGELDVFYPDYQLAFPSGKCVSTRPLPSGRPTYSSKESCCTSAYGGQISDVCMCDTVGICYSCLCGTQADRDATPGGCPELICS